MSSMNSTVGSGHAVRVARRTAHVLGIGLILAASYPSLAADRNPAAGRLTAEQVVERHVTARGGVQAWRTVQALSLSGKMEAGPGDSLARSIRAARGPGAAGTQKMRREIAAGAHKGEGEKQVELPFTLARQLPNRSRLEIEFAGKTAIQVFDGTNGWKLRPYLNRDDVEPFTAEEVKAVTESDDLDDLLVDYAAKGKTVELEGVEPVEGHDAYKLKVTAANGSVRRVWIDTASFLDVKVEGAPRRMDGKMHAVWVIQRDFRPVQGLKIPFVRETVVEGFPQAHRIFLDKVAVNPTLDASTFARPRA